MEHARLPAMRASHLVHVYEAFLSAHIGLMVIMDRSYTYAFPLESKLHYRINQLFGLHPHHAAGYWTAFFLFAMTIGICIFLLLQLFRRSPKGLLSISGFISLLLPPLAWAHNVWIIGQSNSGINLGPASLIEIGAVVTCAFLYACRGWPIPTWGGIPLLVLHYWFWSWMYFGSDSLYLPGIIFPLTGLGSSITWAARVASEKSPGRTTATEASA